MITTEFRRLFGSALTIGVLLVSGPAKAQFVGALDQFASQNGGNAAQIGIAAAIQSICPSLVGSFGGLQGALDAPESSAKDITLRCNELVQTAVVFNNPNSAPPRALGYTDPNDLLAALQHVTGEEISTQNTLTVRASNSQFSNIAARIGALRLAAAGAGTTGPATAFNFGVDNVGGDGLMAGNAGALLGGGASADDSGTLRRAGFFINGSYNDGDRDESDFENGFDFDSVSVTAGLDYRFDNAVLGVSVGYDDFSSEFTPSAGVSGGDIEADGISGSIFGLVNVGRFFIDGIATFGSLDYDIDRILQYDSLNTSANCQCPDQNRTLISASDGDFTSVSINAGWQWYADAWLIQPTFGLSMRNYQIDGYTEEDTLSTGGMELRYGDQDTDSLQSIVGLQVSRAIDRDFGVIRPWFGVEWYHEFEDDPSIVLAKYAQEDVLAAANPGSNFSADLRNCLSCFQISGDGPDSDYGVVGAGLSFVFPNFVQLLFYFETLVGYNDLTSNAFTVNFRSQF